MNFLASHPSGKRFALAYYHVNRLDLFSAGGVRYATVSGPRPTSTSFSQSGGRLVFGDSATSAYWAIEATDQYLYALFCGCPTNRTVGEPTVERPRTIHVFDWNGHLVRELVFDRPVVKMALDGESLVYAGIESPIPEVGEFPIPRPGTEGLPTVMGWMQAGVVPRSETPARWW